MVTGVVIVVGVVCDGKLIGQAGESEWWRREAFLLVVVQPSIKSRR